MTGIQVARAFVAALVACAATFFAGLILRGGNVVDWPSWKIAAQAGVAFGLVFLLCVLIYLLRRPRI